MPKTIGERIRDARELKKISQEELGRACKITKQTIYKYETGVITNIPLDKLEIIADVLGVSSAYLAGWSDDSTPMPSNIIPMPAMRKVPLVGSIACGTPILAEENLDGTVEAPDHVRADFALRCKGDSMINARIFDGDIVIVNRTPVASNGEIVVALIGDEATVKRFYKENGHFRLQPENDYMEPIIVDSVAILGKVVGVYRLY